MKKGIVFIKSGFFGRSRGKDYLVDAEGRGDWAIALVNELSRNYDVVCELGNLRNDVKYVKAEIHFEFQAPTTSAPRLGVILEDVRTRPQNYLVQHSAYKAIVSWDDRYNLAARWKFFPCFYPHNIPSCNVSELECIERNYFSSMIATNRNVLFDRQRSLYNARQEIISWYERNAPDRFFLFGRRWAQPFVKAGIISRAVAELRSKTNIGQQELQLRVWKGEAASKREVLSNSLFSYCLENISGLPGYFSEKLLDVIAYGAIPIYAASDPGLPILKKFDYIDWFKFRTVSELHRVIHSMSCHEIRERRRNGFKQLEEWREVVGVPQFVSAFRRAAQYVGLHV
jgi:hypothetical protein